MTKRTTGEFTRSPFDSYSTPTAAVQPILPWLRTDIGNGSFAEPCAGDGKLVEYLESQGFRCAYQGDVQNGQDAMFWTNPENASVIVTNPPWTRPIMHNLIDHFIFLHKPVWILTDADWMHTKQAVPYLRHCTKIISVGRVKWIEDSKTSGYDNVAWYRFRKSRSPTRTQFIARTVD